MDKPKSKPVALRLAPELVEALEREADGVPLATFITALLKRHVRDRKPAE